MNTNSIEAFMSPFACAFDFYTAMLVINNVKTTSIDLITNKINKLLKKTYELKEVEKFVTKIKLKSELYGLNFFSNTTTLIKTINEVKEFDYDIEFNCSDRVCLFCNSKLNEIMTINKSYQAVTYKVNNKPLKTNLNAKVCTICKAIHFPFYAQREKEKKIKSEFYKSDYICFTRETVIEKKILDSVTADLLFKHGSFKGYCDSYNYLNDNSNADQPRDELTEERITENWLYYKMIQFQLEKNGSIDSMTFKPMYELDIALREIKSQFMPFLAKKWSGEHHMSNCTSQSCSRIICIDGDWKINRLRCMYEKDTMSVQEISNQIDSLILFMS
jgi:hypothetical protein